MSATTNPYFFRVTVEESRAYPGTWVVTTWANHAIIWRSLRDSEADARQAAEFAREAMRAVQ